jgi:Sap, sulfolipid-1-addressing protein
VWVTVLAIALIAALDPMRLGIAFLLISQPRPVRSLLAYWLGAMAAAIISAMALLTVLRHLTPRLTEYVVAVTGSSAAGYFQIALGVAALPLAVLVAMGVFPRQRAMEMAGGPSSGFEPPSAPSALSRLTSGEHNGRGGRAFWMAVVAGVVSATPPVEYLVVLAAILGSGAATGTQFSAAVIFIVVALAAIEIPLISCLVTPARGEALILQLHGWVRVHSQQIMAVVFAVGGVLLMASGIGGT